MSYEWKITRLEKKKENGITKDVIIGVTCTNTANGIKGYIDWSVAIEDISCVGSKPTKTELKAYIKDYLKEDISDEDEDSYSRVAQLKAQADRVIITHEADDTIPENERTIAGL